MKALLSLVFLTFSLFAMENKLPDCYVMSGMDVKQQAPQKEVFVVLDQTTIMSDSVQNYVFNSTRKFIKAGNAINIITFSSNQGNRFTQVPFSGLLNSPLTKRQHNSMSKKQLRKFDKCLKKQRNVASDRIYKALKTAYKESSSNIPNSDIFLNFYQVVENGVSVSKAKEKVVIISSDMLENSTISSFYASGNVKSLDVNKEFKKYLNSELETDYLGSRVFIVGAGVTAKKRYNDPKKMRRLNKFWKKYFQHNNAQLIEFGQPIPLSEAY